MSGETINLRSIFGGNPDDAGASGKMRRYEHDDVLAALPLILPPDKLPANVVDSAEGVEYAQAHAAFAEQLEYLRNVVASGGGEVGQAIYNLTLCRQAQDRLVAAASAPAIQQEFRAIDEAQEARLRAWETPLPQPQG